MPRHIEMTHLFYRDEGGDFVKDWKNFEPVKTGAFLAVSNGPNDILFREGGKLRQLPVFAIDLKVQTPHVLRRDFIPEAGQHLSNLRVFREDLLANNGDSVVWREIMFVVIESKEVE